MSLREKLERRLTELRAELADGEKMIADLQARQSQLRETLLRISGAVQVLEEELEGASEGEEAGGEDEASEAVVVAAPQPAAWP